MIPGSFRLKSSSKVGSSFRAPLAKEKLEFLRHQERAAADRGRGLIPGTKSEIKHNIILNLNSFYHI